MYLCYIIHDGNLKEGRVRLTILLYRRHGRVGLWSETNPASPEITDKRQPISTATFLTVVSFIVGHGIDSTLSELCYEIRLREKRQITADFFLWAILILTTYSLHRFFYHYIDFYFDASLFNVLILQSISYTCT